MTWKFDVPRLPELRPAARFRVVWWSAAAIVSLCCHPTSAQTSVYESNSFWGVNMLCSTPALPPTALNIAPSAGAVTLSWPVTGSNSFSSSNYVLDVTTDASVSDSWSFVSPPATLSGDEMVATLPATNDQQFFRLRAPDHCRAPVFQFAVFYDGLLEFSSISTWLSTGRVHANSDIYTGSASQVTLNRTVTAVGTISSPANNGAGTNWTYKGVFNGNPAHVTNVPPLLLYPEDLTTNTHALIDMPPPWIPPTNATERARLYNLASVILLISNTTATAKIQAAPSAGEVPGNDPFPTIIGPIFTTNLIALAANFPFLNLTNTITDQRESATGTKRVYPADIDLAKYKQWIATNTLVTSKTIAPTILYVANNRPHSATVLPAVRLKNGKDLPSNGGLGFTVVTPNPLYVVGHYNCPDNTHLGTTNTSATVPAALMSDALTILSENWLDSQSGSSYAMRKAKDTTINCAILTGNVPSTGTGNTQFSGGVHNLVRLLEDWLSSGQKTLTLNTSFVCLFPSNQATNKYRNPGNYGLPNPYFDPPKRNYSLDARFLNVSNLPPGTPLVCTIGP